MYTIETVTRVLRAASGQVLLATGMFLSQAGAVMASPGDIDGQIATSRIASRYAANVQPARTASASAASYSNPPPYGGAAWTNAAQRGAVDNVYGGAEYLLIRTHFSQAIGFVDASGAVANGLPTQSVSSQEIKFPYSSAFRVYVGYHLTPAAALQLTYFHLGNTASLSGTPSAPNHTFIDAYGDVATFGQTMSGTSSVTLNVFDLDFVGRYAVGRQLTLRPAAGVRWADVRQHNDSTVTDPLAGVIGSGTFNTHFTGFGPHGSLLGQARFRPDSPFSFIARGAGSLLIGGYSNTSGATFPGVAAGNQTAHRTLTVPVVEAEVGGAWQPTDNLMFSVGWLWQAWFDLGVSGGTTYNGKFAESDTAGIMSFDGLFVRGLWRY